MMYRQPMFVYIYIYVCRALGPLGAPQDPKWRLLLLQGCRFRTCDAQRVRDMDKSTTQFYEERLTAAPRLVQIL